MKKAIALTIIFCLMTLTISACGTQEDADSRDGNTLYADYDGITMKIGSIYNTKEPFGYRENTLPADEVFKRLDTISKNYNCNLELVDLSVDYVPKLTAAISTMSNISDIFYGPAYETRAVANAGGFIPISDVSDILDIYDFDKWGTLNVQEAIMVKGVQYGLVPCAWVELFPHFNYLLVTNNDIVKTFNMPDFRELLEQGKWDRAALENAIISCNDKSLSTPIYGIAAATTHMLRASILSNGCDMIVEKNGELISGWDTPEALEAMQWLQNFVKNNIECFYNGKGNAITAPQSGVWGYTAPFINGEAAMLLTSFAGVIGSIVFDIKDFSILPWPVGPSGTYGEWGCYSENALHVSIPVCAEDYEISAIITDEIFEPLDSYPTSEAVDQYYIDQVFHDPRDYALIKQASKSAQFCYWPEGGDDMLNAMSVNFFTKTPAENISSTISLITEVVEEHIMPNYLAIKELEANIPQQ